MYLGLGIDHLDYVRYVVWMIYGLGSNFISPSDPASRFSLRMNQGSKFTARPGSGGGAAISAADVAYL